jgi:hypothetical protein
MPCVRLTEPIDAFKAVLDFCYTGECYIPKIPSCVANVSSFSLMDKKDSADLAPTALASSGQGHGQLSFDADENAENVDAINAISTLLICADKYDVCELRSACEQQLCLHGISQSSVCDLLLLATMHSAVMLRNLCVQFICQRGMLPLLVNTQSWKNLGRDNCMLYGEILAEIASNINSGLAGGRGKGGRGVDDEDGANPAAKRQKTRA